MIPTWPSTLPRPMRDSWQASPQDARIKRRTDNGPAGYRRKFSSAARLVTLSIDVGRDGKAVFDNFLAGDCAGGALPFYMPDPTTDGWPLLGDDGTPLLTDEGVPLLLANIWLCQFGDNMPAETVIGVRFRIAFSIAVMP